MRTWKLTTDDLYEPAFLEVCSLETCVRIRRLQLLWMIASGRPGYSEEDLLARLSDVYGGVLSSTPLTLR